MTMQREETLTLRRALGAGSPHPSCALRGVNDVVPWSDFLRPCLSQAALIELAGEAVLLDVTEQFTAALALVALDGLAKRIVICPPGLPNDHRDAVRRKAEATEIIDDEWMRHNWLPQGEAAQAGPVIETEWLLLTSGTTGVPKLVKHTLRGLTGAIAPRPASQPSPIWATFYDIRRYGGLQILLRAILGASTIVLPGSHEALSDILRRFGAERVTNISGTPSHWRRVLMNPAASAIAPHYVRLSGEIADQAILDALAQRFRPAQVGHAYASTEAGVGFEVNDGKEGFPPSMLNVDAPVAMKVVDDTLRIRSVRTANGYVGEPVSLRDADGFVDTGDVVLRRGERFYFAGRRGGIINVGGQKVHPEEIEAVINRHHAVRMSLVKSRRSPITGSIVAAEVVLNDHESSENTDSVRREIDTACRSALASWKVPASIRFVESLDMTVAGKLMRSSAA